jgi:hypothetical protein
MFARSAASFRGNSARSRLQVIWVLAEALELWVVVVDFEENLDTVDITTLRNAACDDKSAA